MLGKNPGFYWHRHGWINSNRYSKLCSLISNIKMSEINMMTGKVKIREYSNKSIKQIGFRENT